MRPSWGSLDFLTSSSRLPLGFVWWEPCASSALRGGACAASERLCGGLLSSSWASPVLRLFPLLGVHFRPFPTIRILGYSLPPSELSALGVGAISSGITGRLSSLSAQDTEHGGIALVTINQTGQLGGGADTSPQELHGGVVQLVRGLVNLALQGGVGVPALPDPATGGGFSLFALCSIAE